MTSENKKKTLRKNKQTLQPEDVDTHNMHVKSALDRENALPRAPKDKPEAAGNTSSAPDMQIHAAYEAAVHSLQKQCDSLIKERDRYKNLLVRTAADLQNLRKRSSKEKTDALRFAMQGFARELLSVHDNFERAFRYVRFLQDEAEKEESEEDSTTGVTEQSILAHADKIPPFLEGVDLTRKEMQSVFRRHRIIRFHPAGEPFDPNFHQAVGQMPAEEGEKSKVVKEVVQDGFMMGDRVLRPAMVVTTR